MNLGCYRCPCRVVPLARNLEADGMVQTDVGVDGVPLLITAEVSSDCA